MFAARFTSTGHLVNWEKLREGADRPGLTPGQRVALLLRAANFGQLSAGEISELAGAALIRARSDFVVQLPDVERERLRNNLMVLTDGSAAERAALAADAAKHVEQYCVIAPRFSAAGARPERLIASTLAIGLDYGLLLLTQEPFSRYLRRCRYSHCGKYFLARASRGAPPKHCSLKHGRLADSEAAAARMRRLRSRR